MDHVNLPLLGVDDTVDEAIERMNAVDRRFILVKFAPGVFRSMSNTEILAAWREGVTSLRDIRGGEEVTTVQLVQVATAGGVVQTLTAANIVSRSWEDPHREAVRRLMDDKGNSFGISSADSNVRPGSVIDVFTLHEGIRDRARSSTKECVCSDNPKHQGTSPPENEGPKCPLCSKPTWRCA